MSSIAVAGVITSDGPVPQERVHTLLTVPDVNLGDPAGERWEAGVAVWGYPTGLPDLWDPCSDGTNRTKEESSDQPTAVFHSYELYVPIMCSARGNALELAERANRVMRVTQAWGVEKALSQGVVGLGNKYLADSDLVSLATTVSARVGISYLENAIAATGRRGLIHVTPAVADALGVYDDRADASAPVYTRAGTPIAIGAGYVGANPHLQQGALPAPTTTKDWIFGTGPVEVRINADVRQLPEDVAEALERSSNDLVYRAEKVAVASWDTALQVGVLVDWTL